MIALTVTPLIRPNSWHLLSPLWQGDDRQVRSGLPHKQLAPAWQMMLLGDGSPTRYLQLLTGEPTLIDLIDMSSVGESNDRAPAQILQVPECAAVSALQAFQRRAFLVRAAGDQ